MAAHARPRAAAHPPARRRPRRRATAAIADLISAENGKSIREATVEASRCGDVIRTSAFEGAHLYGESLPRDAAPGTGFDKIGFTVRQPCGVVLAVTPFNYPGLLAIHKIAPALAAGNAVVLKPAELTPLTALALADCFLEAGLPGPVRSVVTGHGSEIGDALVADPRVRKVSFTGSTAVATAGDQTLNRPDRAPLAVLGMFIVLRGSPSEADPDEGERCPPTRNGASWSVRAQRSRTG